MLRNCPRHRVQQPSAGRYFGKAHLLGVWNGGQIDHALFEAEDLPTCKVTAGDLEHSPGRLSSQEFAVAAVGASSFPLDQLETIGLAKGEDLGPDVVDLQDRGLGLRPPDKGSRLATAFDQASTSELGEHLAHGHA